MINKQTDVKYKIYYTVYIAYNAISKVYIVKYTPIALLSDTTPGACKLTMLFHALLTNLVHQGKDPVQHHHKVTGM